jgi:hypothetical protein
MSSNYGKLPLSFEINRGQTDSQVRFLARGQGYGLFLTLRDAVLSLRAAQFRTGQVKASKSATGKGTKADKPARSAVVRMRLARANSNPEISRCRLALISLELLLMTPEPLARVTRATITQLQLRKSR